MRIRTGFVSNSSTSSFCVFGIGFNELNEARDALKISGKPTKKMGCKHTFDRITNKQCPECGEPAYFIQDYHNWLEGKLDEACDDFGLKLFNKCYYGYGVYIGLDVNGIGQKLIDDMITTNKTIREVFDREAAIFEGSYND